MKTIVTKIKTIFEQRAPFDYCSTQVQLPDSVASAALQYISSIPDDHIHYSEDHGKEDDPHITIKYGLDCDDPKKVQGILNKFNCPIKVKLGKTSLFTDNPDFDVLKVDVESEDLKKLNGLISKEIPHTDTHEEYKPHMTLAYLKKEASKTYSNNDIFDGAEVSFSDAVFSSRNGKKTPLKLVVYK